MGLCTAFVFSALVEFTVVNFWYRKHKIHGKLKATTNGETHATNGETHATNFSNIDPTKAVSIWENEEVRRPANILPFLTFLKI